MKKICVFLGSNDGGRAEYTEAAKHLAQIIAQRNMTLVYGGGNVGLMKTIADTALAAGGKVIGVIPQHLVNAKVAHAGLTKLYVVSSMHQRKKTMERLANAFIVLPGSLGTLDELFEILSWAKLELHAKPCGLLNVGGYFDHLLRFLDHSVQEHFTQQAHRDMLLVATTPEDLLDQFARYQPPKTDLYIRHAA